MKRKINYWAKGFPLSDENLQILAGLQARLYRRNQPNRQTPAFSPQNGSSDPQSIKAGEIKRGLNV